MAVTTKTNGRNVDAEYSNVKETFPESTAATSGTVSTVNNLEKVVGVGTVFTTDFQRGDHIWFTTTDELVEIRNIVDDLNMTLSRPAPTSVTGVAFSIVKKSDNNFKTVSWLIDAANPAKINEIDYPASTSRSYGNDKPNGQGGGNRISPIIVDSTGNSNIVYVSAE